MITEREKQEIIEQVLLRIPEVVGNLIMNQVNLLKMNREFYSKHKEFAKHKDTVASVVEMIEGQSPHLDYKDILTQAVPEIKKRLNLVKDLDMNISKPNRDLSKLNLDHGDL